MTKLDHFFIIFVWIVLSGLVVAHACKNISDRGEEGEMSTKKIEEVLNEHRDELMSVSGVVGIGQGLCKGNPCIKVFAAKKTPDLRKQIPNILEGYPVKIEETGQFQAR